MPTDKRTGLQEVTRLGRLIDKHEDDAKDIRARLRALYVELNKAGVSVADMAAARGLAWGTVRAAMQDHEKGT